MRTLLALLLLATACAEPAKGANDPSAEGHPFPDEGPTGNKPPPTGRCYADLDCKADGYVCLMEGKNKGAGTCVRLDPANVPNHLPNGTIRVGPPS